MNNMALDVDPLSNYEYSAYNYNSLPEGYYESLNVRHDSHIDTYNNQQYNTHAVCNDNTKPIQSEPMTNAHKNNNDIEKPKETNRDSNNTAEEQDIKPVINDTLVKKEKLRGKRSSYWSVKITDKDFPFYGCSVCNISFSELHALDQHVTVHKDRITSYDLRVQKQIKKKLMKKEQKSKKKIKKENDFPTDIEIKPEDGYIGTEKAAEYDENNENQVKNDNNSLKNGENTVKNTNNSCNANAAEDNRSNKKIPEAQNDVKPNTEEETQRKDLLNLQKIYKCFACHKQFNLSYYLKLHVRSHTDEKPYTCTICGQSFITASKLGRHNKRIHLAIRYQCRICYRFFSQFDLLTRHFDKKHPDDKLEGEPYDYNAILPYLKELEEELREKAEEQKKAKMDSLWPDQWCGDDHPDVINDAPKDEEQGELEDSKDYDQEFGSPPLDLIVEDVKADYEEVDIKKEEVDDDTRNDAEDSCSDEDYFPSNSWARASSPGAAPSPPPSPRAPRAARAARARARADGPITCDVCRKHISSTTYLRIHMRTHTGERPFECYICGRGFITSSKMHRHVLTHAESLDGTEVKVEDLKQESENDADEKPVKQKGKKGKKTKAKFPKKRAKDGGEKQKRRYQKRPHACEYCQKRFLHLDTLQVHKRSHKDEPLVLKCNFCLEEARDEAALRLHEASHGGPKPYLCTQCGKSYKKRETLMYHIKHHKPDKREYICDICSKNYNSPGKLQRHIISHSIDKFVLRYECPVCAHMFNTKYHVQMHLSTHLKEGLILEENRNEILAMVLQNARKIPKQANAPANLSDTIPSDERSRICNICGEIFQHFYYLEEHLKSHGSKIAIEDLNKPEEKKYTCQVCQKSFKLHYYLKLHSFTHTKEKPFMCQQCGKGFITKGKLKRHLETHTGLKKYQCHVCYKFFTRPSYLRIHVRTIHGTQDYNFRLDKDYNSVGSFGALSVVSHGSV